MTDKGKVTLLIQRAAEGDRLAASDLIPLVYDELRGVAQAYLRQERSGHTLQATALVNEAYLRLADAEGLELKDRAHFLRFAGRVMRRVLMDHARGRNAEKRGGGITPVLLDDTLALTKGDQLEFLALEEALSKLEKRDERMARVVGTPVL